MTIFKITFYFLLTVLIVSSMMWLILIFHTFPKKYYLDEKNKDPEKIGIVVLTGGKMRIEKGISLLENGYGKKLFVSGVFQSTEIETKYRSKKKIESKFECCIFFGEKAKNTVENAYEVERWLNENNEINSIILVTSYYHIPRSMIIFNKIIPNYKIIPTPAVKKIKFSGKLSFHIKLIFSEYFKVIYTLMTVK